MRNKLYVGLVLSISISLIGCGNSGTEDPQAAPSPSSIVAVSDVVSNLDLTDNTQPDTAAITAITAAPTATRIINAINISNPCSVKVTTSRFLSFIVFPFFFLYSPVILPQNLPKKLLFTKIHTNIILFAHDFHKY